MPPHRGPQRPSPLTARISPSREPRRLATRTGLRASRLIPGQASLSPLRLHVRTTLHSGHPTVTDCSTVRLTTSHAPNQFQRVETPSLGSAPAKAGAHRAPPTRRATTTPAPRSQGSLGSASCAGGFDARRAQRGSNNWCAVRSQSSLTTQRERAPLMRKALRSPPGRSPARIAGDPGSPPSRRRRWHCGSPPRSGCVVSRVHRPSHVGEPFSSRSAVMPPASPARTTYLMPNMPSFGASPAPCQGTRPEAFLT